MTQHLLNSKRRQQNQLLYRWGGGALKPVFSKELVLVEWRRSSIFYAHSLRRFELWTRLLFQDTYLTSCEVKSARQNKNPIFLFRILAFFAWCIEGILYPKKIHWGPTLKKTNIQSSSSFILNRECNLQELDLAAQSVESESLETPPPPDLKFNYISNYFVSSNALDLHD